MSKNALSLGLLASLLMVATVSHADDKSICLDAASKGQNLRDAHKLAEARDQFRTCARRECPAIVQQDCGGWLTEVEKSLPTVVITAKDGAGADLTEVRVAVDGQPLATKLDGQAVAINPGRHLVHFELADGTALDQEILVKEGGKDQAVAVVLGRPPTTLSIGNKASATAGTSAHGGASGPWKTVGWMLAGVGVVGVGVGTAFGVVAINDKSSAHCVADMCLAGPLSDARTAAIIADVGLIAGGVLLASGATLVLFGPRATEGHEGSTARMEIAPTAGPHGGGVVLGGSW
jgi:hypothetical protein